MIRAGLAFALITALGACAPVRDAAYYDALADNASDTIANVLAEGDARPWADVGPVLRFADDSEARRLAVPMALKGAKLGYFGDPMMTAQYNAGQLERMRSEDAGFTATRDLDGDGASETYRTGFWMLPDGTTGTFLTVFENGIQKGFADTRNRGVFLSWHDGLSVADCNCADGWNVRFAADVLALAWQGDSPPE